MLPGKNKFGDPNTEDKYTHKLPEVHDVMQGLREAADKYNAVLIGETWTDNVGELKDYYGGKHDELQMPMDLMLTKLKFSAPVFREHIGAVDASGEWPTWVISNHDIVRSWNRYGDGKHNDQIAKDMAAMYLTLRGTSMMYYGEEIGMRTTIRAQGRRERPDRPDGLAEGDRARRRTHSHAMERHSQCRLHHRNPWLPVPVTYKTYNVADELKDPNSILNWYKGLLALRHQDKALLDGEYIALDQDDPNVFSYLRKFQVRRFW